MEQNNLPKNIRQIVEKENWIRVYIEDYVHTYMQRLKELEEGGIAGGILLGRKQRINGVMHLFIRGAVTVKDPFWKTQGQTPAKTAAENSIYFPGLEICGFFFSSKNTRASEVDLVRIYEKHFPGEYQILFQNGEQEEVFAYSGHSMVKLTGYYIYYEKNEEMQAYIMRNESLRILDQKKSAERIPEYQNENSTEQSIRSAEKKPDRDLGRKRRRKLLAGTDVPAEETGGKAGGKPAAEKKNRVDILVRLVSVAGIFVLAFVLFSDQIHLSKINQAASQGSSLVEEILAKGSGTVKTEDVSGDSSGTEKGAVKTETDGKSGDSNNIDGSTGTEGSAGTGNSTGTEESAEAGNKAGAEGNAAVGGSTGTKGNTGTEGSTGTKGNTGTGSSTGTEGNAGTGSSTGIEGSEGTEKEESRSVAGTYVFPMKYLVKKGDSLYAISEKYYGTGDMVDAICLENNISDPMRLKYGTILTLPKR